MAQKTTLQVTHSIRYEIDPNEADFAIASTSSLASPGELNRMVLKSYGYSEIDLPDSRLSKGYAWIENPKQKPILIVVTVDSGPTEETLRNNLFRAIMDSPERFEKQNVWLPLMGTGVGELSLERSFEITSQVLNELQSLLFATNFLVSIPASPEGTKFMKTVIPGNTEGPEEKTTSTSQNGPGAEEWQNLLQHFGFKEDAQYYLIQSPARRGGAVAKFMQEGVWSADRVGGRGEPHINRVKEGDGVFLRSVSKQKSGTLHRIHALGVVTENLHEGHIYIRWITEAFFQNTKSLARINQAISPLNDLNTVAELMDYSKPHFTRGEGPGPIVPRGSFTATIAADDPKGPDLLDIRGDVLAFSRILAAQKFNPPLALALFGEWGSGKSFFMNKLTDEIKDLSETEKDSPYCKGIAQIHFNAWTYLDENLWASMVSQLFEELFIHLSGLPLSDQEKEKIQEDLKGQLSMVQEELKELELQKEGLNLELAEYKNDRKNLLSGITKKINEIKAHSHRDIVNKLQEKYGGEEKLNELLNSASLPSVDSFKELVPQEFWDNPVALYNQFQSANTWIKQLFRSKNFFKRIYWALGLIGLIIIVPPLLRQWDTFKAGYLWLTQVGLSSLTFVGLLFRQFKSTYDSLHPIASVLWKNKTEYEEEIEEKRFEYQQKEKALNLEIQKANAEVSIINQRIHEMQSRIKELAFRAEKTSTQDMLYSFIERRAKSRDYQKHLGVVSTIRRDFKILSEFFEAYQLESENPAFERYKGKPLERIVLYVDDLDRCTEERVVEVLEAVNLLMAWPLFIVVVGVDQRWVKNALYKKHHTQFSGLISDTEQVSKDLIIETTNYLEKIFQIPFHLKPPSDVGVKNMIDALTMNNLKKEEQEFDEGENEKATPVIHEAKDSTIVVNDDPFESVVPTGEDKEVEQELPDYPKSVELDKEEVKFMKALTPIIGNNPRAVKRFVNVYFIIRAHEELGKGRELELRELAAMQFLLALGIGDFHTMLPMVRGFIDRAATESTFDHLFQNRDHFINEPPSSTEVVLEEILHTNDELRGILKLGPQILEEFEPFIRRFTF